MPVFRYEWRQLRAYTMGWALAVGFLIFAMYPLYYDMIGSGAADLSAMAGGGLLQFIGMDAEILMKPIGVYGFLTAFFSIAAGVCGMFLGLRTFTKETVNNTAEFLYTKPFKRRVVFVAKVVSAALSAVLIGLCYALASVLSAAVNVPGPLPMAQFWLTGLSFLWIELFFVLLGALVGVAQPKIRAPMLVSAGVAFVFYVFSSFASKVGAEAVKFFTPFSYFNVSRIVALGGYDPGYLAAWGLLCALFLLAAMATFIRKDVTFVS